MVLFKDKMTPVTNFTTLFLAVTILLYPLLAVFAAKGLVALLVLPVLLILLAERNREAIAGALPRPILILLAGLAVWSLITIWWSPRPLEGLWLWVRVVGVGLCGVVLIATAAKATAMERRFLMFALVVSGWFFVALFAFELLTGGSLSRLAISLWNLLTPWDSEPPEPSLLLLQASAALAVFAWPCLLAIRRRGSTTGAVLFGISVGALLLVQNLEASLVAFACAVVAHGAVYKYRGWGIAVFLALLALVNIVLVFAAFETVAGDRDSGLLSALSGGAKERLHIIDYVYGKIIEHPFIGWGFDASRAIGQDTLGGFGVNKSIPLHPHNLWAQTWLELGLMGLALVVSLVVAIAMGITAGGRGRVMASLCAAALVSYLLIGNISYGMWQNWWLAIAWLNAGFLAMMAAEDP